jgi:hypothetical protein
MRKLPGLADEDRIGIFITVSFVGFSPAPLWKSGGRGGFLKLIIDTPCGLCRRVLHKVCLKIPRHFCGLGTSSYRESLSDIPDVFGQQTAYKYREKPSVCNEFKT